jgi:hypothetical protein
MCVHRPSGGTVPVKLTCTVAVPLASSSDPMPQAASVATVIAPHHKRLLLIS